MATPVIVGADGVLRRSDAQPGLARSFPSAQLCDSAASLFAGRRWWAVSTPPTLADLATDWSRDKYVVPVEPGKLAEGPTFFLGVSPGAVRLAARDLAKAERAAVAAQDRSARLPMLERGERFPSSTPGFPSSAYGRGASRGGRGRVWSQKSRRRFMLHLASLDYAPFMDTTRRLALVTLTYPGDWLSAAPDSPTVKSHLRALRERWRRRWGSEPHAVWKLEFQSRGAPHYHLLVTLPQGPTLGQFRAWLADAWASIVLKTHGNLGEFDSHLLAGVQVDVTGAARMRDVKRLAVYFTKHGLKASGDKEYQHRVPDAWPEGAGRFWGVWKLDVAVATVHLTPSQFIHARRLLRRWSRNKVLVNGRLQGGFVLLNDGPSFAAQVARYLDSVPDG